eukprot:2929691-Amphidinium_carterae.1
MPKPRYGSQHKKNQPPKPTPTTKPDTKKDDRQTNKPPQTDSLGLWCWGVVEIAFACTWGVCGVCAWTWVSFEIRLRSGRHEQTRAEPTTL